MKKLILSGTCAFALVGSLAHAQTATTTQSTTTTATTGTGATTRKTATTTTVDMMAGTITEFTPGTSVILKTEAAAPVTYKFSKTVTYVDESGKRFETSTLRKDSRVRVKHSKGGNDTVVDRVVVLK